jgi:hypothetical protein
MPAGRNRAPRCSPASGKRGFAASAINPEGASMALEDKWIVPVASRKKALLNQKKSRLVLYKRNMPVTASSTEVENRYAELTAAARAKAETTAVPLYDLAIPLGRYRQQQSYYSFQNHFPELYGLSESGLSGAEDNKRKALAFQLKAYLLFDQIMANYFAQLSRVKDLLSANPDLEQTFLPGGGSLRLRQNFTRTTRSLRSRKWSKMTTPSRIGVTAF